MSALKQQIRERIALLLTDLPTSGTRLYPAKRTPWDQGAGQMPGIAFYLDSETITPADKEGRQQHDLSLVVELAAHGADSTVEDALIAMEAEVEQALGADRHLGALLSQPLTLVRVGPPASDTRNGSASAVRQAEYRLRYATRLGNPASLA